MKHKTFPLCGDEMTTMEETTMKAKESSDLKKIYIEDIVILMKKCNDIPLLDLIYKLLVRSCK